MNLHGTCHWGLINISRPSNLKNQQQVMGRLQRYRQRGQVHWVVCRVRDSVHDIFELKGIERLVNQQAAEAHFGALDQYIPGDIKDMLLWDMIRVHYNLSFNRQAWQYRRAEDGKDFVDC